MYLSCGGGRQSTALALMIIRQEMPLKVNAILFADTGWERAETYANISRLRVYSHLQGGPPVITVNSGKSIRDTARQQQRPPSLPFHVKVNLEITPRMQLRRLKKALRALKAGRQQLLWDANAEITDFEAAIAADEILSYIQTGDAMLRRECTHRYKIEPIYAFIVEDTLQRYGTACNEACPAVQLIGFGRDELTRASPSKDARFYHRFPLIEMGLRTEDCIAYMESIGYPVPCRSSCIGCPYHSNAEWRSLSASEFDDACAFDDENRKHLQRRSHADYGFLGSETYLHRARKPLREVDFTVSDTLDLTTEECTGGCFL